MKLETGQDWIMGPEMPHEKLMDEKDLDFKDLSPIIQQDIRNFDVLYTKALQDGNISEEEHELLFEQSNKIAQKILAENDDDSEPNQNQSDDDGTGTGIVIGVFAGILASFGLGKLLKS